MFHKGDKIRLKNGRLHTMKTDGLPPRAGRRSRSKDTSELPVIRGFIRGALVDVVTGEGEPSDWAENVITVTGHSTIIRNFIGAAGSSVAQWWGLGSTTNTAAASSNLSTAQLLTSEYGTQSVGAGTATRANVSLSQAIAGVWTLSQSWPYPNSQVAADAVINCLAQFGTASVGAGSALSMATFTQSTKGTGQALNITYNWSFGT